MFKQQIRTRIDDIEVAGAELQDEHLRLVSGGLEPGQSHVIIITQAPFDWIDAADPGF